MRHYSNPLLALIVACAIGFFATSGCASTNEVNRSDSAENEEVEVGYGTQSKDASTGAISTVSGEEVRDQRVVNDLSDLLRGNVAGVEVSEGPGGGIQVRIRGANSFYSSNEPLYVVDGMPVEPGAGGTVSFVNPYDVESITVLKDASATAIYGARGGNGVILIRTRSAD